MYSNKQQTKPHLSL